MIVKEKQDGNDVIKLFTKSDLVKLYAENYKEKYKINDFMTKQSQTFTVSPSNSLHTVMKILIKERISRVVVTNRDSKIVGIVTSKDLMPITAFAESDRIQANEGYNNNYEQDETVKTNLSSIGHAMIVSDVMKKPITVKSTDDLAIAAQIMTDKRISGIPVTDSNDNDLTGIVTKTDVVKALVTTLNQ